MVINETINQTLTTNSTALADQSLNTSISNKILFYVSQFLFKLEDLIKSVVGSHATLIMLGLAVIFFLLWWKK